MTIASETPASRHRRTASAASGRSGSIIPTSPDARRPLGTASSASPGHLANTFRCAAMTLEMPFKDAANNPMPEVGWSPERSMKLAGSCLEAMLVMIDDWEAGL